ncbi:hypothetical protein [Deinococcus sp. YIM 77859]|uniref:hypothetical protein n=1 Tax=Deinococcus sp. YIM 77859 TaxID=1540221 RepID=UPI0012E00A9B|nr:hypothetical protein [Deinococcus sp. YIM 77859]
MKKTSSGEIKFGRDVKYSAALLFNPALIIALQSILALVLIWHQASSDPGYIIFVILPLIIYLLYHTVIQRVQLSRTSFDATPNDYFLPASYYFCALLICFITVLNAFAILNLVVYYGGISRAVDMLGSQSIVTELQANLPRYMTYIMGANYALPVLIAPVLLRRVGFGSLILILVSSVFATIFGSLLASRIIFIDIIVSIIVITSLKYRLSIRSAVILLLFILLSFLGLVYLQASRIDSDWKKGLETLTKYYSVSILNGFNVISHNQQGQTLYWTLRSTFDIPFVSQALGTESVYEGLFGHIPIKTRRDDFSYAAKLGADPRYNTFGIYGYSFLDAGMWGMMILLASYVIVSILYRDYRRLGRIGIMLFPPMYSLVLDQLRTNSIYSSRAPFFIITAVVIYLFDKIVRRYLERNRLTQNGLDLNRYRKPVANGYSWRVDR